MEKEEEEKNLVFPRYPPKLKRQEAIFIEKPPPPPQSLEIKSCCFTANFLIVLLLSSMVISCATIIFCFVMLYKTIDDCSSQQNYLTILCTVVGVWLPSPTSMMSKKSK